MPPDVLKVQAVICLSMLPQKHKALSWFPESKTQELVRQIEKASMPPGVHKVLGDASVYLLGF